LRLRLVPGITIRHPLFSNEKQAAPASHSLGVESDLPSSEELASRRLGHCALESLEIALRSISRPNFECAGRGGAN